MSNITDYIFYNSIKETPQSIYDSYNSLIFSGDSRVFNKMTKKIELYLKVKDLAGDIFEFGVFKGAGIALFLNLKSMYEPNSLMKVIGFDYFNPIITTDLLDGLNKLMMSSVLNRANNSELLLESVEKKLSNFNMDSYKLIEGDAVITSTQFRLTNPGARIKLLYMDIDLGEPTYNILKTLWNIVVKNGIIVFDEYAYHKWDESNGVDTFLKEIEGQYTFFDTKIGSPTAYIIKTQCLPSGVIALSDLNECIRKHITSST
jgi:hypothetical protein